MRTHYTQTYVCEYKYISVVSFSLVKMSVPTNAFVVSSDQARVWSSIVSLSRRYLPATSWKLVRFGFPGSYIANLVGSQDRRNDRFDRSWIFARCFAIVLSPAVSSRPASSRCPFPFFFISTYVFRAACFYRHEWDFMTSRHTAVPFSANSPLPLALQPSSCDSYPDRILYREERGTTTPKSREDFFDREATHPAP